MNPPEAVLLMGIQAVGKSTFATDRLRDTHVRLNLDMLGTQARETLLLEACLKGLTSFVVDNTNVIRAVRQRYISAARAAGFRVIGYFFESRIMDALARNAARERRVPDAGVRDARNRLELPRLDEGFDELHFVRIENGTFIIEPWRHEV
ncbi:MAG: AAA family ATPase [Prosthecobacter sp.]